MKMLPAALKSSRDFVMQQVENEIRAAKSYEELEEALAALLSPSMAPDALESFLAGAMTMAAGTRRGVCPDGGGRRWLKIH